MNILITSIGANPAITAIKLFDRNKTRIVGTDRQDAYYLAGSYFCDKFYLVPSAEDSFYIEKINEVCNKEKIDAIIPIYDTEVEILSKYRTKLETKLIASPYKTVKICNDKWETYKFFSSNNIPTPITCLENVSKNIGNDVIYKLRRGVGTKGIIDDGLKYENVPSEYIAQKKITGQEYTIDCFCGENGELIYAVPRKRIEVRFGICYKGETVNNEIFLKNVNKIISNLKFYGPINLQVFLTPENEQFIIEINPRLGASSIITKAAGIDMGDCIVKLINNDELKPINNYKLIRMNRFLSEIFYDIKKD